MISLKQDELVFSDSCDEIPVDQILEKCIVLTKNDFMQKFGSNGFKASRNGYNGIDGGVRFYFCERGINLSRGLLLPEDWFNARARYLNVSVPKEKSAPRFKVKVASKAQKIDAVKPIPVSKQELKPNHDEDFDVLSDELEVDSSGSEAVVTTDDESDESESEISDDYDSECEKPKRKMKPKSKVVSIKFKRQISPRKFQKAKLISYKLSERSAPATEASSVYQKASENLHVSAVPLSLPCREDEFAAIYTQLESAIEEEEGTCIYISGVPGTGKTATVTSVVRALQERVEQDDFPPFQLVELNGMKLTEPTQAYVKLWEALTGNKASATHAENLLYTYFSTPRPDRQPCVVIMDELDLLVTKKQTLVYNFVI